MNIMGGFNLGVRYDSKVGQILIWAGARAYDYFHDKPSKSDSEFYLQEIFFQVLIGVYLIHLIQFHRFEKSE